MNKKVKLSLTILGNACTNMALLQYIMYINCKQSIYCCTSDRYKTEKIKKARTLCISLYIATGIIIASPLSHKI